MTDTSPIFIVSSGRSGTKMMERMLGLYPDVQIEHEYMVNILQPANTKFAMGLISEAELLQTIDDTYGAALQFTDKRIWADSSNKASWIIDILAERFPTAKFVHLVRDGRKVTSSYLHKLAEECYEPKAMASLMAHMVDPMNTPCPPPEKKYWWYAPPQGNPYHMAFQMYDQFERMAFHWAEINRRTMRQLSDINEDRWIRVHLEDLVADERVLRVMLDFMELPFSREAYKLLQTPHNVNRPIDQLLTPIQSQRFDDIAHDVMEHLGYAGTPEYAVSY